MKEKLDKTKVIFDNFDNDKDIREDESIFKILKNSEKNKEIVTILSKGVSIGLLIDFLDHLNEAMRCLKHKKVSMTYELIRKPFKENLLYLEWLNYNPVELCDLIYNNEIYKCAIGKGGVNRHKIKTIVEHNVINNRLLNKITNNNLNSNEIYNVRYNYDSLNSMELVWNKAVHLSTSAKKIKSEDFNFIYCNEEIIDEHLDYIYSKLPFLLIHTIGVFEMIFVKYFKEINEESMLYNDYLILEHCLESNKPYNSKIPFGNIFKGNKTYLICEKCKKVISIDCSVENRYFNYNWYLCPECDNMIEINKYYFINK